MFGPGLFARSGSWVRLSSAPRAFLCLAFTILPLGHSSDAALARIDVLLQYLSRSVAARFVYGNLEAPALTNACRENYGTRTQSEKATRKRSGRGMGDSKMLG
jgi:hypothetical protein